MNPLKILLLITTLLYASIQSQSQDQAFRKQRNQLTVYNIGVNSLIGGFGRLLHKPKDTPGHKAFLEGLYQGALGGSLNHLGLHLTHQIAKRRNITLAWPARLVNALGSSLIQNTAEGRRLFERLHFNLFLTRLEYYPYQKKFRARIFTSSIYSAIYVGVQGRLSIGKSLQTGILYFESSGKFSSAAPRPSEAVAFTNSIGMGKLEPGQYYYDIYAHEVAHILQYDRFVGANALFYQVDQKLKEKARWYKQLAQVFYFDLNGPLFFVLYKLAGSTHNCNLFEQEAENYSNRSAYLCE